MSTLLPNGKQQFFTATGAPGVGYKLYTYIPGTTTPKATFRTYAGTPANTNPVIADSRGECEVYWSGDYDVVLKDASGVLIWGPARLTEPETSGTSAALRSDLATTNNAVKGAALVGYSKTLAYASDTVGKKLQESINVKEFGAVGDGATDDTAAIQSAITYAGSSFSGDWFTSVGSYTVPRVVEFPSAVYKITGTLLIPSGVELQGNRSTLLGSGYTGSDNVAIESAYFSGGSLLTNIGTSNETHRVVHAKIQGFRFVNFKTGVNVFNLNEGCSVEDNVFYNCRQAIIAKRCFYSRWIGNASRGTAGASTLPCFAFDDAVNAMVVESNFVIDRVLAMEFTGTGNALTFRGNSAESCTNGVRFTGSMSPMSFTDNYFEYVSGTAVEFITGVLHYAPTITGNFFNTCGTGIIGVAVLGGLISDSNLFVSCTYLVNISDVLSSIEVQIRPDNVSTGVTSLPSGYTLGQRVRSRYPIYMYNGSDIQVRADHTDGFAILPMVGKQGYVPGTVPFCTCTVAGTTTMSLSIQTRIVYTQHVMAIFSLTVTDNGGTYGLVGRSVANDVFMDTIVGGKTVTATDVGGYLKLTVTGLTHPTGVCTYSGIVRMI
jgi:hypothetical protein